MPPTVGTPLDALSSLPKYRAHLRPVWDALHEKMRGEWHELDGAVRLDFQPAKRKRSVALVASYSDMRAARRHGYGRIALLEHGIGQSYSGHDADLPGGDDRGAVGLFLSPNEHSAGRDQARYPRARVVVVGSPVLDELPRKPKRSEPPAIALTFHWHYPRIPERGSAFVSFVPAITELAQHYQVIGHAHPQAVGMVLATYRAAGVEFERDYRRILEVADVLVGDNTSALYEFASTGRPVVVLNSPAYRRDVEHGLRFWQAAEVGVNIDEPGQLVAGVAQALEDKPAQKAARKRALGVVYAYPTGAAKRAAKALTEWLA